jgi:hypothetical protein
MTEYLIAKISKRYAGAKALCILALNTALKGRSSTGFYLAFIREISGEIAFP